MSVYRPRPRYQRERPYLFWAWAVAGPSNQSITLNQATETGTPAEVTPLPGAVSITLDQATEIGTANDLTVSALATVVLDQATETGAPAEVTPVPGLVAIALDQATETGIPAEVTPSPGAVVVTLDQVAETGTPDDLTPVPGTALVALDQATETGTPAELTPSIAGAQTIAIEQVTEVGTPAEYNFGGGSTFRSPWHPAYWSTDGGIPVAKNTTTMKKASDDKRFSLYDKAHLPRINIPISPAVAKRLNVSKKIRVVLEGEVNGVTAQGMEPNMAELSLSLSRNQIDDGNNEYSRLDASFDEDS